jgi:NAD(P)-dependent dehydrogenase (short-subunit alcohol dehydrogenase family)
MKIVIIGGTGLIGTKLVQNLRQRGHEVVAASPSSGVNTITGEGLGEALAGAQVVVDVANAPSWEDQAVMEFFETSGRNLLAAEAAAGGATSRGTVGRRHRSSIGERILPREDSSRKPDQSLLDSLLHRPRHSVLRVRGRHRSIGDRGAIRSIASRFDAAYRSG